MLFGAAGAVLLPACSSDDSTSGSPTTSSVATSSVGAAPDGATPSCVVRPELTEGPFYVDERLDRSDIRSDPSNGAVKPGAPLQLRRVYSQAPYASRGQSFVANASDGIYRRGGSQLLLQLSPAGQGYTTTFDIGLRM